MEKIVAIIVTHNGSSWIDKAIKSLLKSTQQVSIIIIDNNSNDNTVSIIKENFKDDVVLVESKANLGFGKGNNLGLTLAMNKNADYVFLLNQDAFIYEDTIEKLLAVSKKELDYGILSPIHLNYEGSNLEYYFSNFISIENSPNFYSDFILKNKLKDVYQTNFVNAAAWFIPRKTLSEVGGFDPIFWHYGEDDNYCQRVLFHQFKIGVVPNSYIRHDSKKRIFSEDYLFSEKYYLDYEKFLKVKYANINYLLKNNAISYEKGKIWKDFIINTLNRKIYSLKKYYKKYKIINKVFIDIIKSRTINERKGTHYL